MALKMPANFTGAMQIFKFPCNYQNRLPFFKGGIHGTD
jgi:hypothetical protein